MRDKSCHDTIKPCCRAIRQSYAVRLKEITDGSRIIVEGWKPDRLHLRCGKGCGAAIRGVGCGAPKDDVGIMSITRCSPCDGNTGNAACVAKIGLLHRRDDRSTRIKPLDTNEYRAIDKSCCDIEIERKAVCPIREEELYIGIGRLRDRDASHRIIAKGQSSMRTCSKCRARWECDRRC